MPHGLFECLGSWPDKTTIGTLKHSFGILWFVLLPEIVLRNILVEDRKWRSSTYFSFADSFIKVKPP